MNEGTQQYRPHPCPECGGQRVVVECNARMSLSISTFSSIFLQAVSCTNCGYTILYAKDPQKLQKLLPG